MDDAAADMRSAICGRLLATKTYSEQEGVCHLIRDGNAIEPFLRL